MPAKNLATITSFAAFIITPDFGFFSTSFFRLNIGYFFKDIFSKANFAPKKSKSGKICLFWLGILEFPAKLSACAIAKRMSGKLICAVLEPSSKLTIA